MADNMFTQIHMSYAELIVVSTSINTFMTRDSAEFAGYGVDSADITAYLAKITVFENLPTDTEVAAVSIEATATKNQIATELRTMLRGFSERARLAFGTDDAKYVLIIYFIIDKNFSLPCSVRYWKNIFNPKNMLS